jgi:hypothetical protein
MTDSNDTSIALLSQKVDLYREESVNQRVLLKDQLGGITTLLEVHVENLASTLVDHDQRITKNTRDISDVQQAHSRISGILWTAGSVVTIAAVLIAGFWSGIFH